jgi:hypothetical protein
MKFDNVNKSSCRITKHAKLWAKNALDDWQKYQSYDIEKSIQIYLKTKI